MTGYEYLKNLNFKEMENKNGIRKMGYYILNIFFNICSML